MNSAKQTSVCVRMSDGSDFPLSTASLTLNLSGKTIDDFSFLNQMKNLVERCDVGRARFIEHEDRRDSRGGWKFGLPEEVECER